MPEMMTEIMPDMPSMLTTELTLLVYSAILLFVMIVTPLNGKILQPGMFVKLSGNRDDIPESSGWIARAERAYKNMAETFPIFAVLVLAAHSVGVSNDNTVLGAQLYFYGRLAYFPIYVIGIPWIRTGAFGVAVAGMIVILLELL